MTTQARFARRR